MTDLALARSDAHYEALRRAYDERVKSLSRKLRNGGAPAPPPGGGSSSANDHTFSVSESIFDGCTSDINMQNENAPPGSTTSTAAPGLHQNGGGLLSAADSDGQKSFEKVREEQIDTLVEKMSLLSTKEREKETRVQELKQVVDKLTYQCEDFKRDEKHLKLQIAELEKLNKTERELFEKTGREEARKMQEEVGTWRSRCAMLETENRRLKEANESYEQRLQTLYDERAQIQTEVISFSKQSDGIQEQLKQSQELLRQSEMDRNQLRDQYVHVGEKFERLMDLEEKENGATVQELSTRLSKTEKTLRSDKRKMEKLIGELEERLKTADVEVERLGGLLEEERARHAESEQHLLDGQRKTLHEHNLGLAKLSEMMPIASHQQIVDETRRHHHQSQVELEQNLRRQYQKQLQDQADNDEKKQKEFQETLLHVRQGLKKLEQQRDDSGRKCKAFEEENYSLKMSMRKLNTDARDVEDKSKLYANSLEEANANLQRLRKMWDEEKQQRLTSDKTVNDLKRKLAVKEEFFKSQRGVLMDDLERTIGSKLRWAEDETERLLSKTQSADVETDRLRQALAAKDAKIISMLDERSELERKAQHDQAVGKKAVQLLVNCQQTTKLFCDAARRELVYLKKSVHEEVQTVFLDVLSTRCGSLVQMLQQEERNTAKSKQLLKKEVEAVEAKAVVDRQKLQDSLAKERSVGKQLEFVGKERDAVKKEADSLQMKLQDGELNLERILSAITAPFPALENPKEQLLLAAKHPERSSEISEKIKFFRAKLNEALTSMQKEMQSDAEQASQFKLKSMEEKVTHEISLQKEMELKAKTDHERQLAEYAVQMAEMRGTVATMEDRHRSLAGKNHTLEGELKEVEADLKYYTSRCEQLAGELEQKQRREEELVAETEVVVELAKTEAVAPVKEQMKEVFQEAERLQTRFAKDLHDRDQQWEKMVEQIRQDSNALLLQREKEFSNQNSKLEREVEKAREKEQELVAELSRVRQDGIRKESMMLGECDAMEACKKRYEQEAEHLRREMKNVQEATSRQAKTMQEALDLKTRLAEEVQRENRQLVADRDEEIAKMAELKHHELEKLQSHLRSQYAQPSTFSQIVTNHDRLEKEAEGLSAKVKQHLEMKVER
eukprot:CAMPEP_0178991458 /NCGR_PEP_ID=MMETSP0795-20121207/5540_1 /TAXON_ID=88552 /ORGANISM="Amoebophrya sp., Strain Ameob2" /LENGTH=1127 /DNA_ID=CAMNT_0020683171 /DNA_START=87 /DNA_END=3470 /DNA_ORIENTATION=-